MCELFEKATSELESCSIRVGVGSGPFTLTSTDNAEVVQMVPSRYEHEQGSPRLAMRLRATVHVGPPRYEVSLALSGEQTMGALRRLASENAEDWGQILNRAYLWMARSGIVRALRSPAQLVEVEGASVSLIAVYLRFDVPRPVVEGLLLVGTLYRCVLDGVVDAARMHTLCRILCRHLGGRFPHINKTIQPIL